MRRFVVKTDCTINRGNFHVSHKVTFLQFFFCHQKGSPRSSCFTFNGALLPWSVKTEETIGNVGTEQNKTMLFHQIGSCYKMSA